MCSSWSLQASAELAHAGRCGGQKCTVLLEQALPLVRGEEACSDLNGNCILGDWGWSSASTAGCDSEPLTWVVFFFSLRSSVLSGRPHCPYVPNELGCSNGRVCCPLLGMPLSRVKVGSAEFWLGLCAKTAEDEGWTSVWAAEGSAGEN